MEAVGSGVGVSSGPEPFNHLLPVQAPTRSQCEDFDEVARSPGPPGGIRDIHPPNGNLEPAEQPDP